jgi:hypothetical protein
VRQTCDAQDSPVPGDVDGSWFVADAVTRLRLLLRLQRGAERQRDVEPEQRVLCSGQRWQDPRAARGCATWPRARLLGGWGQSVVAELAQRVIAAFEQLARERQARAVAAQLGGGLLVVGAIGRAWPAGDLGGLVQRPAQRRRALAGEMPGSAMTVGLVDSDISCSAALSNGWPTRCKPQPDWLATGRRSCPFGENHPPTAPDADRSLAARLKARSGHRTGMRAVPRGGNLECPCRCRTDAARSAALGSRYLREAIGLPVWSAIWSASTSPLARLCPTS